MNEGDRVKDLRKCDYGEGAIVGHENDGQEFWCIRWDNPGLDNEWLEAKEFQVIQPVVKSVFFFPNGNVAVCDENGQQIPQLQRGWINWEYLRQLSEIIIRDESRAEGMLNIPGNPMFPLLKQLAKGTRECTCGIYPHHELCGAVQDYPDSERKPKSRLNRLHCDALACGHMRFYHEENDGHCKICGCERFTRNEQ